MMRLSLGVIALLFVSGSAFAQVAPSLGTASSYSILAGTQVTNTGPSSISGDVGISPGAGAPGTNHPGLLPAMVGGTIHDADVAAANAQFDASAAYTQLDLLNACTFTYPGAFGELAGQSLVPGVYCATQFRLTSGTLTLVGLASDTWVFKSASDLIVTGGASANVVSPSCDVWWRVVSTATLDAGSSLIGNVLADTSITLAAGAGVSGRIFARTAEVTLSSNVIGACGGACPVITLSPVSLPSGTLGAFYSQTITAAGGAPPYTFAISAGALPPGLTLASSGPDTALISGTPTATGTFSFTVTATDSNTCPGAQPYTIVINAACPALTLLPATLPVGSVGVPYSQTLTASGGTAPYVFSVLGTLPPGLTLVSSGPDTALLSGTPTTAGPFSFTVTATDSNNCAVSQPYTMLIIGAATSVPTLSEWGLILFVALLALSGFIAIRRRASAV